jgi:hypothetical protein
VISDAIRLELLPTPTENLLREANLGRFLNRVETWLLVRLQDQEANDNVAVAP